MLKVPGNQPLFSHVREPGLETAQHPALITPASPAVEPGRAWALASVVNIALIFSRASSLMQHLPCT